MIFCERLKTVLFIGGRMAAPKEILDLVERFERNREAYKSGQ